MRHIAYFQVGENKGAKRIWIEGRKLLESNFTPGCNISVVVDSSAKQVTIKVEEFSDRVVSSRTKGGVAQPIIDICNATITQIFKTIRKIKAVFLKNMIIITVHPDEVARQKRLERLNKKLSANQPLICGSVAHGGGIMDHAIHTGLQESGINSFLGFGIEIEQKYLECSLNNNPVWSDDSLAIEAPIENVSVDDLPEVDIFVAGLPCTGASIAGKSKNKLTHAEEHTGAGALFIAFLNIIKKINPAIVVLENVPQYASTASMAVIRSTMETWGYDLHETILNGNKMGALEGRDRLVMVAVTKGIACALDNITPVRQKESCLADILETFNDHDPVWQEYAYLRIKEVKDKAAGKGFAMQILDSNAISCGTIGRGYSKIRSTEPKIAHPVNPDLMRQLTVSEHAKVKGIPFFLVDGCTNTVAHEILGQSVTYPALQAVGRYLGQMVRQWFAGLQPVDLKPKGHQYTLFGLLKAA